MNSGIESHTVESSKWVDIRNQVEEKIEKLKKKCVFFSDDLINKITHFFDLIGKIFR